MPENKPLHLIVGLGNPGDKYRRTRHNAGFMVVEELARRHGLTFNHKQARAAVAKGTIKGVPVVLALPQTFMNDSGEAVSGLVRWHKLPLDRVLIVYDELDLPLGTIRMRERGSTAGHGGMKSINSHLRTEGFPRLRIGIDKPPSGDTIPWVLGHFNKEEQRELDTVLRNAADAIEAWLTEGITKAMNTYNSGQGAGSRGQGAGGGEQASESKGRGAAGGQRADGHDGGSGQKQQGGESHAGEQGGERRRPELLGLGGQIRELRSRLFGHGGKK